MGDVFRLCFRRESDRQHAAAPDFATSNTYANPDGSHVVVPAMKPRMMAQLPANYMNLASDLRKFSPRERHNQGQSGTCTVNAMTRGLENKRIQLHSLSGVPDYSQHIPLARLVPYYCAREMMDPEETTKDEGTQISLCYEALRIHGIPAENPQPGRPKEECWPFNDATQYVCTPPSWMAMRAGFVHRITAWAKLKSTGNDLVNDVIANLAVGNPVEYGAMITNDWFQYRPGQVIKKSEGVIVGGHATLIVGWDPGRGAFWCENSWGNGWGDDGFYLIEAEAIADDSMCSDFVACEGGWEPWKAVST